MRSTLLVIMALTLASCSSTTTITSSDKEAKIYVDSQYMGKGEFVWSDQKIVSSTTFVTLKKEGCEDKNYFFTRNEKFDVGACIAGALLIVPWLWIMEYNPVHNYEYECVPKK